MQRPLARDGVAGPADRGQPPGGRHEVVEEVVAFQRGCFRLEGALAYPAAVEPAYAVAIAGPHPLLGGDMDNNVVRGLALGLAEHGAATLRFNYCGVGPSEGPRVDVAAQMAAFWNTSHTDTESAWQCDAGAAVAFLRRAAGAMPLLLVGYSFGCAMLLHRPVFHEAAGLALVAPTARIHDYTACRSITTPTLIVASEDDFAGDPAGLQQFARSMPCVWRVVSQRLDNHFFRGHEAWLADLVHEFSRELRSCAAAAGRAG
jgi:hypothetical protein